MTADHQPVSIICAWITLLLLLPVRGSAAVSINLPLDDPVYPLLEKLVTSNLIFSNALTVKPITRLYAARLIAEAIQTRRREYAASQRQEPFIDQILRYASERFRSELRQIGFFYQPRRQGALTLSLLNEIKLDLIGTHDPFVQRDASGVTTNLQGVFSLNEGFVYGNDFTARARLVSWATLWGDLAAYVEPEVIIRSDPILGDRFDTNLHKGYLKVGYRNVELEFGRDTLWWGPAAQGDLVLSNNAPPLDLLKLSTPNPFRLPWLLRHLGEWQMAYVVARLEANRAIPHALLNGLRVTVQPASFLKLGFTNVFQAFGAGGESVGAAAYLEDLFVPRLDSTGPQVNGLVAYDIVLSLPFIRHLTFLNGVKVYWQRGNDNIREMDSWLAGGNLLGGVIDGGWWDLRIEFAETRDAGPIWYTHPTYQNGFSFKGFILGHPIAGAAESLFGRATIYLTPTTWFAADGRRDQYGFDVQPDITTQYRFGLDASHQLTLAQQHLVLWGRFEYARLDRPAVNTQTMVSLYVSARLRF